MERRGKTSALAKQPTVHKGNEWLFDAFMALDTCRSSGMGTLGPLPWDKAMQYCDRMEYDDETTAILWAVLHRADKTFRAELSKRT